jgi:hypothetical protein
MTRSSVRDRRTGRCAGREAEPGSGSLVPPPSRQPQTVVEERSGDPHRTDTDTAASPIEREE